MELFLVGWIGGLALGFFVGYNYGRLKEHLEQMKAR